MAEEQSFDARSVVQALYDEQTKLVAFLQAIEDELTNQGFAPTTAEMYSGVISALNEDIVEAKIPYRVPYQSRP